MTALFLSKFELRFQIILTLTMAVTSFVTGCIANVPVRTDRPSKSFEMDYVKTHMRSTEREIIEQLGLPGLVLRSGTETYYVYRATADLRRVAGIVLIVPPYFVPFFTAKEEDEALHCLALVFDESGFLRGYKTATGSEGAVTGLITPTGPIEIPIGKEEKNCVIALWDEEDRQSLEHIAVYEKFVCPGNPSDHAAWFCPQADKGIADPQRRIGDLFYCGGVRDGLTRDLVRAYVWYSLAARGNNSLAKARLDIVEKELSHEELQEAQRLLEAWVPGQCGIDLAVKDLVKARKNKRAVEREELANAGDADAQLELYYVNLASPNRFKWLCRSADQGNPHAQIEVARLYRQGVGSIEVDLRKAYVWYKLAVRNGHEEYQWKLNEVTESLTSEQLVEAEQIFANWQPGQCERALPSAGPGY